MVTSLLLLSLPLQVVVGDLVQTEKLHRKQAGEWAWKFNREPQSPKASVKTINRERKSVMPVDVGDKVVFGTVLLAGTREWTLLGKPTSVQGPIYNFG